MTSTRVRAERLVLADPASTALLLAGPAALELWPGLRRVEVGGRVQVELEAPAAGPASGPSVVAAASVSAQPPRRTPTAFVTRFAWSGPDLAGTEGVLTLTYAPGEGTASTRAELVLESTGPGAGGPDAPGVDAAVLVRMARTFLDNLGDAAESRRAA